jgi:putative tryptophan/tyrosine transport system substrate-binding protein
MRRREFITLLGSAAGAWPLAARGQQADRLRRVGIISAIAESDPEGRARVAAFVRGLQRAGWTEGRNVRIDYRWGAIDPDRARADAAELAGLAPDAIFAVSAPAVAAMRERTRTIPIVIVQNGDPVQADSVQSFARPGGNVTGFLGFEPTINAKYLQLLKDIAPNVTRVAVMQFENSTWRGDFSAIQAVARSFAVTPIATVVHDAGEIERAMAAFAREPNGGLIMPPDANTNLQRDLIIALAAKHRLPAVYSRRNFVVAGGLLSYGADLFDLYDRAASYVDRILKGEKPGELPVQAPTKFELVINLKTAKALGLDVSTSLQMGASEVIE